MVVQSIGVDSRGATRGRTQKACLNLGTTGTQSCSETSVGKCFATMFTNILIIITTVAVWAIFY